MHKTGVSGVRLGSTHSLRLVRNGTSLGTSGEKRPILQAEKRPDLAVVFRNDEPRREAQYPNGWILLAHISPAATFPQPYGLP
jgi:hypothetical protein